MRMYVCTFQSLANTIVSHETIKLLSQFKQKDNPFVLFKGCNWPAIDIQPFDALNLLNGG